MQRKLKKEVTEADLHLWEQIVRHIQPLKKADRLKMKKIPPRPAIISASLSQPMKKTPVSLYSKLKTEPLQELTPGNLNQLDGSLQRRLKRGELQITARLDLHGYTRDKAYSKLMSFLQQAYQRQGRCVLVITGKGKGGQTGILQQIVPVWLNSHEIRPILLAFCQAQPQDGGAGALYILLRKNRLNDH